MTLRLPAHIPWSVHRVATSGRYPDALHMILSEWSWADVMDAIAVLDAFEDARPER